MSTSPPPLADLLTVHGLHAGHGRIPVLHALSLRLPPAGITVILGNNGSGRSTLLLTLAGHLTASAGSIHLDGTDITRWPPERRARAGIGYVGDGCFPALSVRENLEVAALAARRSVRDALRETLESFPRLSPLLSRPAGVLSGGERRLLALARALGGRPRLLLLDEPTGGLQPAGVAEVCRLLAGLRNNQGMGLVIVEQNRPFIRPLADCILVMDKGRLSAGRPGGLPASHEGGDGQPEHGDGHT